MSIFIRRFNATMRKEQRSKTKINKKNVANSWMCIWHTAHAVAKWPQSFKQRERKCIKLSRSRSQITATHCYFSKLNLLASQPHTYVQICPIDYDLVHLWVLHNRFLGIPINHTYIKKLSSCIKHWALNLRNIDTYRKSIKPSSIVTFKFMFFIFHVYCPIFWALAW